MKDNTGLGELLQTFLNRVSHPRGRVLRLMSEASVTVPQVILLNLASTMPGSTPSSLAANMKMSLPTVSQMIERLVKVGLVQRIEDREDRRRKTVTITTKARTLLTRVRAVRSAEFAAGTAGLSPTTRRRLTEVLVQALHELPSPDRSR
jgi:DNA-binding MarR family transcriptional regulator